MKLDELFPGHEQIEPDLIPGLTEQREFLINGKTRIWNGPFQDVYSPVYVREDGKYEKQKIGFYPMLTEVESMEALDAAERAFDSGRGVWPTMSVRGRIKHIEEFTCRMEEKRDDVVRLLMWEIGKSRKDSIKEFDRTVQYIRDTVDAMKELDRTGSRFQIEEGVIGQIRRSPLGVVLCMGPFNYPLNETFTTLIPALITGNCILFKPPKFGVLLHRPLIEAFMDSFPPGVVNTIYGDGQRIIQPVMESGRVDVLAFIGTSTVADILKRSHPRPHRLRSVLGLEAKNCAIVMPDADLELAADEVMTGTLSYNGQRCTAIKMLFVHSSIVDKFAQMLSLRLDRLKLGMPWDEGVDITPLPEDNKCEFLQSLVEDAVSRGASVLNSRGGEYAKSIFYPALVYPVKKGMRLYTEEQFGPVIPLSSFEKTEEPLDYIVESNYGQQVSIFASDPGVIAELIDPLVNQVARVNINSQCQRGPDKFPFTGRKDSAEGTLSVSDALRVFSIRSLVAARNNSLNKGIIRTILKEDKSNFLSTDFIF